MNLVLGAQRIQELVKKKGSTVNSMLVNDLKLHKSIVDNMKKGSEPSAEKLDMIAQYLETSSSYLLGNTDDPAPAQQKNAPLESIDSNETWRMVLIKRGIISPDREMTEEEEKAFEKAFDAFVKTYSNL